MLASGWRQVIGEWTLYTWIFPFLVQKLRALKTNSRNLHLFMLGRKFSDKYVKRSVFLFLNIVRCWMFQFAWFRKFSRKKHVTNKYTCENLETFIEYPDVWMRYSASPISGQKSEAAQVILPEFCYISIRLPRSLSQ